MYSTSNIYGRPLINRQQKERQEKEIKEKEIKEKEIQSLREDYKKSYINPNNSSSSTDTIFLATITNRMKDKSNINKNIDKIKNYTKKKNTKCTKITKHWYSSKRNGRAEYTCKEKYDKKIRNENNKAINKLYIYSKKKLMKYILRLNKTSEIKKTVNLISKYTKILEEIYGRCKSTSNNLFNYQNLLIKINQDSDLNKFYEMNNAYINFLYKDRDTQDGKIINTLNTLMNINEKFKNIIDNIEKTDTICHV